MGGVFIHVQHLLGIGHQQRMDAIASACVEAGLAVTMATGDASLDPSAVPYKVTGLPDIRAADAAFSGLVAMDGTPVSDDLWDARTLRLLEAFDQANPSVLLVEGFPFARRQFRRELLPLLDAARARGTVILSSIRDILQPKTRTDRISETLSWLETYYDAVLVHGDPRFAPLAVSFAAAEEIAVPVLYTGYVSPAFDKPAGTRPSQDIIVSAGGGAVGATLYRTALDAAREPGADRFRWRLRIGRNSTLHLPPDTQIPAYVRVEDAGADFREALSQAAASVSQAGYNTAVDLMVTGAPAVLVPFAESGQREQSLRADRMASALGSLVLDAENLTPRLLWEAIKSLKGPTGGRNDIDIQGAACTARIVAECAAVGAGALASAHGLRDWNDFG